MLFGFSKVGWRERRKAAGENGEGDGCAPAALCIGTQATA